MSNLLDCHSQFEAKVGLSPITITDNTEQVTETIDLQGYDGCEFIVQTGTLADSDITATVKLFESDASSMSGETEVTAVDSLYGAPTALTAASDGTIQQFGYRGSKRYVRAKIAPANNTGSAPFSACVILRKKKVGTGI